MKHLNPLLIISNLDRERQLLFINGSSGGWVVPMTLASIN